MLVDLTAQRLTGKDAQEALDRAWITVNKNSDPLRHQGPMVTSGIRLGTPAVTTRGMREAEMAEIAELIDRVLGRPRGRRDRGRRAGGGAGAHRAVPALPGPPRGP